MIILIIHEISIEECWFRKIGIFIHLKWEGGVGKILKNSWTKSGAFSPKTSTMKSKLSSKEPNKETAASASMTWSIFFVVSHTIFSHWSPCHPRQKRLNQSRHCYQINQNPWSTCCSESSCCSQEGKGPILCWVNSIRKWVP